MKTKRFLSLFVAVLLCLSSFAVFAEEAVDDMEEVQRITHDPEAESCSSLDDLGKAPED